MTPRSYMIVPLIGFDERETFLLMESGPDGEAFLPLSFRSFEHALAAKNTMEAAVESGEAARHNSRRQSATTEDSICPDAPRRPALPLRLFNL